MPAHDPTDFEGVFGAVMDDGLDDGYVDARAAEWEIEDLVSRARRARSQGE